MSERKVDVEFLRKQCRNDTSLLDEAEIIDVSAFDFDDTDGWLYIPTQSRTESTVQDLYTWLRGEPELILSANKRCVDTRTFTRSKKRSSRTSFESIFETLSSPVSNIWKTSNFSNVEDLNKYSDISTAIKNESVPAMLKMPPTTNFNFLTDEAIPTSGQGSMEVFLNMSQSKGTDSFINLLEPGFSDPLMNISQPSIFYSSITSLSRDDFSHNTDCDKEQELSNLTHTHNQEFYRHKDIKNLNMNETFPKNNNEKYYLYAADETFTNTNMELNETYNTETMCAAAVLSDSDQDKFIATNLSSTIISNNKLQSRSIEKESLSSLNATYLSTYHKLDNQIHSDTTYSALEVEKRAANVPSTLKTDTKQDKNPQCDVQIDTACSTLKNTTQPSTPIANSSFSLIHDDILNSTFKLPLYNQSTPKNMNTLNSTFQTSKRHLESSRIYNTTCGSNFKAPTSLRKELLAEIYRSGDHKLDCTYNHVNKEHQSGNSKKHTSEEMTSQNIRSDIPIENRYNIYKKELSIDTSKPQTEIPNETETCSQNLQDKRYYTLTKKNNVHGGKTDMENAESLENVDTTFVKPLPKLQKQKQHIPRMLSKLPQFLQKSNPNLVSNSLKTVNTTCTNAPSFGYMKVSQSNIVRDIEKSLTNKLYSLGKIKCGSEQRLLELNAGIGEFQILGAGGSTESIESTQSAHSAPDLDDRLSTCSDSSHNSCPRQPMNIEQFQQIVRMQEESLEQDIKPQLNKQVLENAWADMKKDLPSPIVKNDIDDCESNNSSPLSMDFTVKTSSPILSPTRSSQSINTDGQSTDVLKKPNDTVVVKKIEVSNKPMKKTENKTRLRQPMNWNTGNRPSNLVSAIPRPPSRIPGPRFVRPSVKNIQGDVKRGYI